jgi:VPDSG-CTERM motif
MKKFVIYLLSLGIASLACANTITVSTPGQLNGDYAYSLGVNANLPAGQEFSSMTISFDNIRLTSAPKGYLYVDLLNFNTPGLQAIWDGDRSGDAFADDIQNGQGISLGVKEFSRWNQTMSFSITLDSTELLALNTYAQDGIFDIGLDPDCFFWLPQSCCKVTYNCCPQPPPHNVPDGGSTALLLGATLSVLGWVRRKLS